MKKVLPLVLSTLLGLIACQALPGQVLTLPQGAKKLFPQYNPGLSPQLRMGVINNLADKIDPISLGPTRPGVVNLPPGPIREFNPPQQQPLPSPNPPRRGVQFGWGPGGPTLGVPIGSGGQLNIPLRRPGNILNQPVNPPIYQSRGQVLGYGPQGQIYTGDSQVLGSALAPGRNASQFNGTQRVVQQPVYDNFGNIVGYRRGTVWNNSLTGQQHGDMTTFTPNGSGGYHQSTTLYSTAGGNITPKAGR